MNQPKTWAVAFLAAVFVAGAALGWGARGWSAGPRLEPRLRDTRAMVAHLAKELGLSATQQDSVRAVLERHRAEMDTLWHLVHPRVDSLRATIHREITAQLTPAQQSRYRDLIARFEHQRRGADSAGKEHK